MVFWQKVRSTNYSLNTTTGVVTFTSAPPNNAEIEVKHMGLRTTARNTVSMFLDNFTGDGSTTAFTLSNSASVNDVFVFYNGVCMKPTTDYGISGATLTFTFTPVNNSQITRYFVYLVTQKLIRILNTSGQYSCRWFSPDSITTAKIADDAVTDAKLGLGTGQLSLPIANCNFHQLLLLVIKLQMECWLDLINPAGSDTEEYRGGQWKTLSNVVSVTARSKTTSKVILFIHSHQIW